MREQKKAPHLARSGELDLREVLTIVEEHFAPDGGSSGLSTCRAAVAAVVGNPLADRYEEDLGELVKLGEELGRYLAERALRLVDRARVVGIGRAAIVGQDGELEHAAALLGPGFSAAVRKAIGNWRAVAPSTKKLGGPGSIAVLALDYLQDVAGPPLPPLEVRVPGHPRDDEAIVVLALGESPEATRAGSQA